MKGKLQSLQSEIAIQQCINNNNMIKAEELFLEMVNRNISVSQSQLNTFLIKMIQDEKIEVAHQLFKKIPDANSFNYSTLIHGYTNLKDLESVESLIKEMIEKKIEIQIPQFNVFLKSMINENKISEAHQLFIRVNADAIGYSTLIQGYLNMNDLEVAEKLFNEMVDKKIQGISLQQFNIFMTKMIQENKIETVHKIFKKIPIPNRVNYSTLIHGYMNIGGFNQISELFKEMMKKKIPISHSQFIKFTQKMKENEQETDLNCSFLFGHYFQNQQFKEVELLINSMIAKNIPMDELNTGILNDLIMGHDEMDDTIEFKSIEYFQQMIDGKKEMTTTDLVKFNVFMIEMIRADKIEVVHDLFNKIPLRNGVSYSTLIQGYLEKNDLNRVHQLFHEVIDRNIESRDSLLTQFNIFLKILIQHENLEIANDLFKRFPYVDTVSYSTIIQGYWKMNDLEKVGELFNEIIDHKIEMSTSLITQFNNYLTKMIQNNQIDIAHQLFNKIPNVDDSSYSALVQGYLYGNDLDKVEELFDNMIAKKIKIYSKQLQKFLEMKDHDIETMMKFRSILDKIIFRDE